MNTISLFSGAMGLDLGIEKAGFKIKVCVEMNKLACETIRANTDIPVIQKDINDVSSQDILGAANLKKEDVTLIVGGPPCQAFSTAGARRSLSDFRGNVIVNYLRIVQEIQPKYFILENVRGILSAVMSHVPDELDEYKDISNLKGSVMYYLKEEFKKYGYTISFSLFNSANYSIPQKRERVIIFGHRGLERIPLPSPTHSETGLETGKVWTTFGQAVKGLREEDMNYIELSEKAKKYICMLKPGQYWKHLPEELKPEAMGGSYLLGGGKTGFFRRLDYNSPSPTLVTSPSMPATMLAHPEQLRPLSVEEYARIQQFPDNWKVAGGIREVYKQIGNAVPVGLGYMAGKTIVEFMEGKHNPERENINKIPYSRYKNCSDFEFIPLFESVLKKQKNG